MHLKLITKDGYQFFGSENKKEFTFGKKRSNDIVGKLKMISPVQLKFECQPKFWTVENVGDDLGITFNNKIFKRHAVKKLSAGDVVMMCDEEDRENFVILEVMREIKSQPIMNADKKRTIPLLGKNEFIIGRDENCDIVLDSPLAAKRHARIIFDGENHFIEDLKTENGTYVNNKKIKRTALNDEDRIEVPSAAYIYYDNKLLSSKCENGIEVDLVGITKDVPDRAQKKKTVRLVDNVSMRIEMGGFVGIVGGSGAGKSTLLDCINGRRPGTGGSVYYDTNDFYQNMYCYQPVIGYVPQKDILHENLPLFDSLCFTASMRIRNGITQKEITEIVNKVIREVKLEGKEHLKISMLSGGQKKRVSIAMELLSNPKIIFLDEPTSGLSPDLDLEIMSLLKDLSKKGRTIILITHSMDNISLCDKIAFLGRNGRLCFYDSPEKIKTYFKTQDFSKIFYKLGDDDTAEEYAAKYRSTDYYKELMATYKKLYGYMEKGSKG